MRITSCMLFVAVFVLAIQCATVSHAQGIVFDFQDGTDQGWAGAFDNSDVTAHPIVDVNGDGNLWLEITNTGTFTQNAGFTQNNDPSLNFNTSFFAAVNNPTGYVVEYDYIIDTSAGTDGTFFQLSNSFQGGGPGFPIVSPTTVNLSGTDLAAADVFTGSVSIAIPPGIAGTDETFSRFIFRTNGNASDVTVFLDNISIVPVAVPEPGSAAMIAMGILGFASIRRRQMLG